MPHLELSAAADLVHMRRDLPRPIGLSINRYRMMTLYLLDRPAFNAWRAVLEDTDPIVNGDGWLYCVGWLQSPVTDMRVRTMLSIRKEGHQE